MKRRAAWIEHTTRTCLEATQAEQMQISQNLTACRLALTETALTLLKTGDSKDFYGLLVPSRCNIHQFSAWRMSLSQ